MNSEQTFCHIVIYTIQDHSFRSNINNELKSKFGGLEIDQSTYAITSCEDFAEVRDFVFTIISQCAHLKKEGDFISILSPGPLRNHFSARSNEYKRIIKYDFEL
jgi:hypothetical protein